MWMGGASGARTRAALAATRHSGGQHEELPWPLMTPRSHCPSSPAPRPHFLLQQLHNLRGHSHGAHLAARDSITSCGSPLRSTAVDLAHSRGVNERPTLMLSSSHAKNAPRLPLCKDRERRQARCEARTVSLTAARRRRRRQADLPRGGASVTRRAAGRFV